MQAGINPWVVHFFAFFVAVFGELTPPTSITAAITSKIANASFYVTLWRSVQICIALFTLMAGVFVHPELVIEPGLDQFGAALLIGIATIGIVFSLQAIYSDNRLVDRSVRVALAAVALVVLLDRQHDRLGGGGAGGGRDRLLATASAKTGGGRTRSGQA